MAFDLVAGLNPTVADSGDTRGATP